MPDTAYERITVETHPDDNRVQRVALDSADRNNVIDYQMLAELYEAFDAADRNGDIQAIILGTNADVFCSGADVSELTDLEFEDGARWLTLYFDTLDLLRDTGKPVVAAVEGTCVAGGNELVMAADLIVGGESSRFGQPEVGVGSTAAGGGVQLLPLMVGEKRARDLLLTGRLLTAEEARQMGLINRVVPDGDVEERTLELVQTIIDEKSPQAYRTIKAIMKGWSNLGLQNQEMARDMTATIWASDEFRERVEEFTGGSTMKSREFSGTRPYEK